LGNSIFFSPSLFSPPPPPPPTKGKAADRIRLLFSSLPLLFPLSFFLLQPPLRPPSFFLLEKGFTRPRIQFFLPPPSSFFFYIYRFFIRKLGVDTPFFCFLLFLLPKEPSCYETLMRDHSSSSFLSFLPPPISAL